MMAMQIMERCRGAEADRRVLINKINRYRDSAGRMTSALDGVGSRGTSESDRLAAIMGEIDELERAIAWRDREYAAEVSVACRLLDMLPEMEAQVLDRFYLKNQTLAAIARDMSYSYGYIRSVKASGCGHLDALPQGLIASLLPEWYADKKRQR